ncbi:hypothetical protein [Xylanimonas sp. McL0601]|uniref:hypothetical protein n=1 Tax=Xylanimonas sp. McL0601 TaxID=3414739 RepID=UPI003CF5B304
MNADSDLEIYGARRWPDEGTGATHVALATHPGWGVPNGVTTLVLLSDGNVESVEGGAVVPDLPPGQRYSAVAASPYQGYLLRSDGAVVSALLEGVKDQPAPPLPEGKTYVAIDAGVGLAAVRSDGVIVTTFGGACEAAMLPESGLRYTAISVAQSSRSWAALRSDGAVVSCLADGVAQVLLPPEHTVYTGVEAGERFGLAARSDGVVDQFGPGTEPAEGAGDPVLATPPPTVPEGRTVVALSAGVGEYGIGDGVAVLDDGSVLTWSLFNDDPPTPDAVPPGLGITAVSQQREGARLVIVAGDLQTSHLDVSTSSGAVTVRVTSPDFTPRGVITVGFAGDDGTVTPIPGSWWIEGQAVRVDLPAEPRLTPGPHLVEVRFEGPPARSAVMRTEYVVPPLTQLSISSVDVPPTAHMGSHPKFHVSVVTNDGSRPQPFVNAVVDGKPYDSIYATWYGVDHADAYLSIGYGLSPGTHRLELFASTEPNQYDYTDAHVWSGTFEVLPEQATTLSATLPAYARYGFVSSWILTFGLKVDDGFDTADPSSLDLPVDVTINGTSRGQASLLGLPGSRTAGIGMDVGELRPGPNAVTLRFAGLPGLLPSTWSGTVVMPPTSTRVGASPVQPWVSGSPMRLDAEIVVPDRFVEREVYPINGITVAVDGRKVLDDAKFQAGRLSLPTSLSAGRHVVVVSYPGDLPQATGSSTTFAVDVAPTVSVTGSALAGAMLTAQPGTWVLGTALNYQWKANGANVAGATGKTFVPRAAQVGKTITVTVTGRMPGATTISKTSAATAAVTAANQQLGYQGHVQNIGWQPWVTGGQVAGTTGRGLRVEALRFRLNSPAYSGGITAAAHVQNIGWMAPVATGGVVGTQGRGLRVEAFTMQLTGEMAKHYDIYYRTHAQNFGWLGWAKNGAQSGTAGYGYRLEAVDVRLVAKGDPAPSGTALRAFYQR